MDISSCSRSSRKPPSIISRGSRASPWIDDLCPISLCEIDEIDEGLIVHDGIMVYSEVNNYDKNNLNSSHPSKYDSHSSNGAVGGKSAEKMMRRTNVLPGIADEIESFPCQYCADQIFLTPVGLEKHTKALHPAHIDDARNRIREIQDEWRRRESEENRPRYSSCFGGKDYKSGRNMSIFYQPELETHSMARKTFMPCQICRTLINIVHPSAMYNHMSAHKKNDELRKQLLLQFGPSFVHKVTCRDCKLIFPDEKKLLEHINISHARKRKYVCKWCGEVFLSLAVLHMHKSDVHGILHPRCEYARRSRLENPTSSTNNANVNQNVQNYSKAFKNSACRTVCEICGLVIVKPSLIVKHMVRAHDQRTFSALIEMKFMLPIKIEVNEGRLTWWCCDTAFHCKEELVLHRKECHEMTYVPTCGGSSDALDNENQANPSLNISNENRGEVSNAVNEILIERHSPLQSTDTLFPLVQNSGSEEGEWLDDLTCTSASLGKRIQQWKYE